MKSLYTWLKFTSGVLSCRTRRTIIFLLAVLLDFAPQSFENHQSEENDGKRAVTRKEEEVNG